ncbi:MAG: hypothetical protein AAGK37_11050 [Pseudomonadota bacterium]
MSDNPSSRHFKLPTYRRRTPGRTGTVDLYQPRLSKLAPGPRTGEIDHAERLDNFAFRETADPHGSWRVADANKAFDLRDLAIPGRKLRLPEPEE